MEDDKAQQMYKKSRAGQEANKNIHPYSLWAFILAIFPFWGLVFAFIPILNLIYFVLGIPALICSIILAIMSFSRIESEKNRYWGNGFSIAAIVISVIEIILMIVGIIFILALIPNLI